MSRSLRSALLGMLVVIPVTAEAAEIRMLATGATKAIVTELARSFEAASGHTVIITTDTAGGVAKRVEAGEPFDVAIATRGVVETLVGKGKVAAGSSAEIASTSIGVAVKAGAAKPDIATVESFKKMLLDAKTIAYVDPASGGTSGIYIAGVIDKLGLTEALKPKLRLKAGGYVAELVATGDAEVALHQVSEIVPVKGVVLVGGLPAEIQSVTTYTGALAPAASEPARALLAHLAGPAAVPVLAQAGMTKPAAR